jgi:hypothetical protein
MQLNIYCSFCQNFNWDELKVSTDKILKITCKAFPDGIPNIILDAKFDHRKSHDNDNGIIFNPIDDIDTDEIFNLFF